MQQDTKQDKKQLFLSASRLFVAKDYATKLFEDAAFFAMQEVAHAEGVTGSVHLSQIQGFCVKKYPILPVGAVPEIEDILQPITEIGILNRLQGIPGVIPIVGFSMTPDAMLLLLPRFHQDLNDFFIDCATFVHNSSIDQKEVPGSRPGLHFLRSHLNSSITQMNSNSVKKYKQLIVESYCKDIVGQLLSALSSIHERDIIHADIKPSNIVLCFRPMEHRIEAAFCDFSHSRLLALNNGLVSDQKGMVTTEGYRSPELNRQELEDSFRVPKTKNASNSRCYFSHKIDVYSMGMVVQEMSRKIKCDPGTLLPCVAFHLMMQKNTSCRISSKELVKNLGLKLPIKTDRRVQPGQAARKSIRLIQEVSNSLSATTLRKIFGWMERIQLDDNGKWTREFVNTNARRLFFQYADKKPDTITEKNARLILLACYVISSNVCFDEQSDRQSLLLTICDIIFVLEGNIFPIRF